MGSGDKIMVAAHYVRLATDGDLDQKETSQATGVDVNPCSVLQPVQGQVPTIDMVHSCTDAVGFFYATQIMICEDAADALANGFQVIENKQLVFRGEQRRSVKETAAALEDGIQAHGRLTCMHGFKALRTVVLPRFCRIRIVTALTG